MAGFKENPLGGIIRRIAHDVDVRRHPEIQLQEEVGDTQAEIILDHLTTHLRRLMGLEGQGSVVAVTQKQVFTQRRSSAPEITSVAYYPASGGFPIGTTVDDQWQTWQMREDGVFQPDEVVYHRLATRWLRYNAWKPLQDSSIVRFWLQEKDNILQRPPLLERVGMKIYRQQLQDWRKEHKHGSIFH